MKFLLFKQVQQQSWSEQVLIFAQKALRPVALTAGILASSSPLFADSLSFKREAFASEQFVQPIQSSVVKVEGDWLFVDGVSRSDYDLLYRNLKNTQSIDNVQFTSAGTVSFKIALSALQGIKITDCSGAVYGQIRTLKDKIANIDCEVGKYSDTGTTADELSIEERTRKKAQEQTKAEEEKARQQREQEELKRRLQQRLTPWQAWGYGLIPGLSGIYNSNARTVMRVGEVASLFFAVSLSAGQHQTQYTYSPNLLAFMPGATNGTPRITYDRTDTHSALFPNVKVSQTKYSYGLWSSVLGNPTAGALIDMHLAQQTFDRSAHRYNQTVLRAWGFYLLWMAADTTWSLLDSKAEPAVGSASQQSPYSLTPVYVPGIAASGKSTAKRDDYYGLHLTVVIN